MRAVIRRLRNLEERLAPSIEKQALLDAFLERVNRYEAEERGVAYEQVVRESILADKFFGTVTLGTAPFLPY